MHASHSKAPDFKRSCKRDGSIYALEHGNFKPEMVFKQFKDKSVGVHCLELI